MKPCSSPSDPADPHDPAGPPARPDSAAGAGGAGLFGPMFGTARVDRELDAQAWLAAMLDVERALAAAQARAGLIPAGAARQIADACQAGRYDAASIAARAVASATPVVPLVADLSAQLPPQVTAYVHFGATSQDVLDTAAALVTRRALGPVLADLAAAADACAGLAGAHRDTVLAARTLLQHALPSTFGLTCAGWLVALDEAREGLTTVRERRLAAQLGGAAGTLAALGADGLTVLRHLAAELDLAEPTLPWHTNRVRVAELAGALGTVAGVLGKIALDVLLLAQTDVAEVAEAADAGRGGSSALPHKRNPVGAVLVAAATRRVPGLVATLLAAMAQEHQRAAGGWQAEWEPLTELLRLVGGAAAGTRQVLCGLRVDPERMRRNLAASGDVLLAESVAGRLAPGLGRAAAHELVARLSRQAVQTGRTLGELLRADPQVRAELSTEQIDQALDPAGYLGSAGELVDRALAAHRKAES